MGSGVKKGWLSLAAFFLLLGGAITYFQVQDYNHIGVQEKENLAKLAEIIGKNLAPQIVLADHIITNIVNALPSWRAENDGFKRANRDIKIINDTINGIPPLLVMDADGTVIVSSEPKLLGMNFAYRDYFITAKNHPDPAILQVSAPFKTVLNDYAFTLLRTLKGANGKFAGIVVVTEVPAYFTNLLNSVRHSPDVLTSITHGDGKMFLTSPLNEDLINKNLARPGTFFTRHRQSGRATTVFTGFTYATGDLRIVAQRSLQLTTPKMDKPLVIGVTRKLSVVYEPWKRTTVILSCFFALLALISVLVMYFYQKRQRVYDHLFAIQEAERKKMEAEKHALEQQFLQAQKLESLGVLSGGIAHDFNNILAIVMGNCSLIRMNAENTENYVLAIETATERAAALCRQMLAYAGKAQLTKTQVNMRTMVEEMITMLKSTLPQNTSIIPNLSADTPYIYADASQLRQVVMNLILNASEAIGTEQGEIEVSLATTTVVADRPEKDYHGKDIQPGGYVRFEITDNGCGMEDQTKRRIFEPFYTTKFTGRGLGMSAVLGIINSHNGALQLFSQPGHGTTFKVYLPVQKSDQATYEDQNASASTEHWQGSGTILLVEDEDTIRRIAGELLNKLGFTVLEAANGKEALKLYKKNAADITLVFTDIGMPVMDGYALFAELKKLNPELPFIVSSGFGDADIVSRIGRENIAGLITKPYTPAKLREVLRMVLESMSPDRT